MAPIRLTPEDPSQPTDGVPRRDLEDKPAAKGNGGRRRRRPKASDPLHHELIAGENAASKELSLIMDSIRYGQFADLDPPLPVDVFIRLRNIAMIRRFFSLTVEQISQRLILPIADINALTAHPHYQTVLSAINEAARKVAGMESIYSVAKEAETRIGKELLLTGVGGSSREKFKALESLADRLSPKRPRADGKQAAERVFSPDTIELIKMGLEVGLGHRDRKPAEVEAHVNRPNLPALPASIDVDTDDTIDAETLNVPSG